MYNNKRLYIQRNFLTFSQISSLFVENFKNLNIFINIFFAVNLNALEWLSYR